MSAFLSVRRELFASLLASHAEIGINQRAIARRAAVTAPYLTNLKNGSRNHVTPAVADRLAEALSVPRSVLFVDCGSTTAGRNDQ